ncbi:uncharacterized protein LOC123546466 isoform X2 [Mercenaria mercenaria]|uniref:uncharacterized protein LOC123546466 isoform X2 n=1 Tax=Mercenaria mercenaria TaxID=6596 RepID=UPI00234EA942|nr:uncharacterized protein LOC123546466 isoform X2 [Mercenaria mercenaria]
MHSCNESGRRYQTKSGFTQREMTGMHMVELLEHTYGRIWLVTGNQNWSSSFRYQNIVEIPHPKTERVATPVTRQRQ